MRLPDGNGIDLVRHIASSYPNIPVAMITAHGSMESAVAAMKAGAFDFVSKPVDLKLLRRLVEAALRLRTRGRPGGGPGPATALLGDSPQMSRFAASSPNSRATRPPSLSAARVAPARNWPRG